MKKVCIIICSVIYFLAIVIVAFLGFRAEIQNPPYYAEDIVLLYDCPHDEYDNGNIIFTVTENLDYTQEVLNKTGDEIVYKYDIHITDFEFIYEVLDGKINVPAKPITHKYDDEGNNLIPTQLGLSYNIVSEDVICDNEGNIQFLVSKSNGVYTLLVKAIDGTSTSIFIRLYW